MRFKPDGSAFEQFSSRGGNTWGLDITWDGQVFWTQPTSGTVFFHTVLPESVLAKGRLPGTTLVQRHDHGTEHLPAHDLAGAGLRADRPGRQFTAAAGCADLRRRRVAGQVALQLLHRRADAEHRAPGIREARRRQLHDARRKPDARRPSSSAASDIWFRPIETRVGPDGALYVVDFYNQAVIHNDTRGPLHGPANAAVRPDRDHYFGRIWRVQHKQAKKLDVPDLSRADLPRLIRVMQTSPNAHVKQTAWRLAHENYASDKRLAQIKPAHGEHGAQTYEQAQAATTAAARKGVLDSFATSTDNWTQSALVSAATEQAPAYIAESLTYNRPQALTDFVAAVLPAALPGHAAGLLVNAAAAGPDAAVLKASIVRADCANGRRGDCARRSHDRRPPDAARRS